MELGINRNMHSEITTFLGRSVDSELSGNMIDDVRGSLTLQALPLHGTRAWELQRRKSVSPHDSGRQPSGPGQARHRDAVASRE